jgi:hypothetical protein
MSDNMARNMSCNHGTINQNQSNPITGLTDPEGSRRLRLPDFKTICTWRWWGCQQKISESRNNVIINCPTQFHLVGYFYKIYKDTILIFRRNKKSLFSSKRPEWPLGLKQLHIKWVSRLLFLEVKWRKHETDRLPASSADMMTSVVTLNVFKLLPEEPLVKFTL